MKRIILGIGLLAATGSAALFLSGRYETGITWLGSRHSHEARLETPVPRSEDAFYQCPMHPQVVSDVPGFCPICHMALVRVEKKPRTKDDVPGHSDFSLSSGEEKLIGLRTIRVSRTELWHTIPAPGKVVNQTGLVRAEVFEFEAAHLSKGQRAEVVGANPTGQRLTATVLPFSRAVDPATRTQGVELLLDRGQGPVEPGVLVEVFIFSSLGRALAIPREAVMDTGAQKIAYVREAGGHIQPRSLVLGREGDSLVEVLKGLGEGEEVVNGANFLIDSESRRQSLGMEAQSHAH